MHTTPRKNSFVALEKASAAANVALALSLSVPSRMRPLADQLIRCSSSVPANLSEGHGRTGKSRRHLWQIAYGSAKESDVFLKLLAEAGAGHAGEYTVEADEFIQCMQDPANPSRGTFGDRKSVV